MVAYCVDVQDDCTAGRSCRKASPQKLFGGLALACIATACASTLYNNLAADRGDGIVTAPTVTIVTAQPAAPVATARPPSAQAKSAERGFLVAPVFDVALLEGNPVAPPATFSVGQPVKLAVHAFRPVMTPMPAQIVQSIPIPTPRPAELAQLSNPTLRPWHKKSESPFEKLFGKRDAGLTLAYAPSDGSSNNSSSSKLPANDGQIAIYDIRARTVYLPDGSKLEAHSGLGPKMDDPRHVNVRMHGPTPPHVYDLVPREALFHGVEALRLIPVGGEGAIFGRTGLLAHTYLLGPNGDSNGCVSFKDYDAFLRAYKNGRVKRMVVVASLDDPQLDLRMVDRPPAKAARTYVAAAEPAFSPPQDDRYLSAFSAARASRTSSSARSFSSLPE